MCRVGQEGRTAQWGVPSDSIQKQLRTFGANLRRERIRRDMTQEQLAERADLNIRTLQKIEAGQTNILVTTAQRLKRALRCDWDALLG